VEAVKSGNQARWIGRGRLPKAARRAARLAGRQVPSMWEGGNFKAKGSNDRGRGAIKNQQSCLNALA